MATKNKVGSIKATQPRFEVLEDDPEQYEGARFYDPATQPSNEEEPEGRTLGGTVKDIGISALKGAIAVPEAAVGLADLVSGGQAGKSLEELGFRPKDAKAMLAEGYSPAQKEAFRRVQAAEGLGDTFLQAVQNPSVIGHSVVESLPLMGAGGVVARGGLALAPRVAPVVAGAAGEGLVGAGSAAEQIRQQTPDGLLTGTQAGLAATTGVATAGFGYLGGRIAQKLGIADVDTMLTGAVADPALRKGVVRSALEGAFAEGFLEELPQSVSEQVLQNIALDKPLDEGVDQAIVLGLLSGSTMGAGANVVSSLGGQPAGGMPNAAVAPPPEPIVPAGPLTRAANRAAVTNLQAVQSEELGMPDVAQTTPPDGAAILAYQQKLEQQQRENQLAAQRAEASPDDEIYASTGAAPPIMAAAGLPGAPAPKKAPAADQPRSKAVVNEVAPAAEPASPAGQFASAEEAQKYISQQRRASGVELPQALPVQNEDGTFGVATQGSAQFEEAQRQGKARLLAAGVQDGDLLTPKGDIIKTKMAANAIAKKNGGQVVPVTGGFVVRKTEQVDDAKNGVQPAAAGGDGAGRPDAAPGVGSRAADAAESGGDTGRLPDADVGESGQLPARAAEGALKPANAGALNLRDKTVTEMTDDELQRGLAQATGEMAKRAPKIRKEMKRRGLVADEAAEALLGAGLELDDGVTPGKWIKKVSGLNDVMVDIISKPGEPVRAKIRAQRMGGDVAESEAEGLPAILENINTMAEGLEEYRRREAQKMLAENGLPAAEGQKALPATGPADRITREGGEPFKTMASATAAMKRQGAADTHAVQEVAGGFVAVRKPGAALENATAPEHVTTGVDDRELGEIVEVFNKAQESMIEDGEQVTHVFEKPAKGEIVRLADKVKVYNKDNGWMTVEQAKKQIAEWKAKARDQGKNAGASENGNSQRIVLSLFDLTGAWSKPWEEAGYQVYRFDIQDDPDMGDVNNFSTEFFNDNFGSFDGMDVYAVLAACPCTDFAVSGARHFAAKDADGRTVASVKLVQQTQAVVEYFKPPVWAIENPVGRIEKLGGLPPWRLSFDPNHLGDPYTKKTLLWGRFNADLPIAPVEPTEGSKMHRLYGGKSQATKNARSETPEGFSYGFFLANNAVDHPVMAIANKFDRLDRGLIEKAVAAGVTEAQINQAVEDFYYQDLNDEAANDAIRALANPTPPAGKKDEAKSDWTTLGRNKAGKLLVKDKRGVRSYVENGIRIEEPVQMIPTRQGMRISTDPKGDFLTVEEAAEDSGQNDELDAEMRSYEAKAGPVENLFTGNPDLKNTPPMQALDGYKVGETVDITSRTFGQGKIEVLFKREMAGMSPSSMARVVREDGKKLDVLTSELKKVEPTAAQAAKPDALSEAEKAAKAKMLGAAGKLAALLSKNTRASITPEQEQAMLPIVIELFEGAMALGYVKFKQAARYVREYIAQAIDQDAADSIPIDTLQGAYIATARRHSDKDITPKKDVIAVESVAELTEELEKPAKPADTGAQDNGNATQQLDQPGPRALEGAPAQDVRPPESGGQTGAGPDGGGAGDLFGNAGSDDAGSNAGRGVGADPRAVPVPARGTRANAQDGKKPRVSRADRAAAGDGLFGAAGGITPQDGANPAPNAPAIPAPQPAAEDFTITDELALGEGGQKTKFKNNIAAIKLVRDLESTGRMATPEEQAVLAKYVGWGGLPQAFDANNSDWAKEYAEITALMSEEELASARQSTRYAHYTSREIIVDGIYAALRQFGFNGGKTLEAGAGVGNFIGLMPADMRSAGRFTAIEREPFSSAIARQLYPQQGVQRADFTEFKGTDSYFDAAVGNPPFASDPQTDRSGRKHLSGLSLHNYFFAKSIDMLREGGIMAQVVTNAFMDAKGDRARKYMSDRVELLGAIRLPNSAFAKNANTEVTTDIIFFKKRPDGEIGSKAARADAKRWLDIGTYTDKNGKEVALNQYFIDNPNMMLGDFGAFGTMYGPDQPALVAKAGQDTLTMLKEAVGRLPAGVYQSIADTGTDSQVNAAVVALKNPSVKEGGYFIEGEKLMQRLPDIAGEARGVEITPETQWTEKTKLGQGGFDRIKALAAMRGTVRGLLGAEMADDADSMKELRKKLNEQYDTYRDTHGLINDPSTLRVFEGDPDFPLLASLEHGYTPGIGPAAAKSLGIKPTKSTAKKGPIFNQRVVAARQTVQKVETPADAMTVSMAERGKLDAAYIGQLLGMEPDAVLKELSTGDKPLLFRDPATDEYVLRDAYLSGNVREKLAQARQAGMFTNINALEAVQPEDVGSHEITARLGSPWIPTEVYEDFAKSLFGEESKAHVFYLKANSSFQVMVTGASDVAMNNTWGTREYDGDALLQALMNNRSVKVTYRDSEGKTHTDVDATERANTKGQEVKERFNDWLFSDPERSELLTKAYNETNNNYVTRVYDGSNMTFPGKVPDSVIKFRRHQRNAIARIVQDRTALLDHVVGAGKTFTVISGAMELKRTGLARKPMVAVPNHLVKQWAADFYRLYPGANVLTATKKDFEKANRRKFLAKIATGDWDAVVIAHSSYGFIKPSPEFEAEFNGREIQKIMTTIQAVDDSDGDKQTKKRTIKQLEGMKERLENRIRQLRDKPMDDLLDFEQIGVDQLFVDEAHMFKNLMYTTKMQGVAGLNDPTGSQRAYDMYVKTNQIMEKNGRGQGVVFATGTPVSNSLAEMYHMMRYLMPAQMKALGFESFDAWANTYASVEQVWMQAPSGDGFKATNRMSNFVNTPELLKMFDQVSDTVTMDDIKKAYSEENNGAEFPLPKLKGGRRTPVSLAKSKAQDDYMAEIAKRALAIEKRRGPPKKGDDNILVVMSDARKAAMDIRLVDPDVTEREAGGRIDRATDEVVARYRKFDSVKGTQLVFSDLGTPLKHAKKELKEYEELQARVQAGNEDVAASATLGNEAAMGIMEDAEAAQAELDAMGPDWLSAVKAALRGFSVYDDFKAALIEKGIPEAEIAFIHDYNTDDQKASLFRKVNAGQIRVLLGSTAKLGAGTNVQERLVAEHHLDVPWRPSDVEQREGRIERQGNRLMTDWPDFEIEILAYVTRDTLDMRMWQVQETKLKMINQLRTRKIGREIDNAFEDMELSAGEMQAAATGDMNLLKEIQLRNDVKKLEQRRRSFDGQRNDLMSRKRRNAEQLRDLPKKLRVAEEEATFAAKYLSDRFENAPPFKMNIDGKDYTDANEAREYLRAKDEATEEVTDLAGEKTTKKAPLSVTIDGELIKNRATMAELFANARGDIEPIAWTVNGETYRRRTVLANAMRQSVMNALADETVQQVGTIGDYAVAVEGSTDKSGVMELEVTMRRDGDVKLSNTLWVTESNAAPARVIALVENLLDSAVREADYLDRALKRAQKDAADLEKTEMVGEWPDQAKLDAARAAHKDVLAQLKKKEEAAEPAAPQGDGEEDPVYSRAAAAADVSDDQTGVATALLELGKNADLYQLPKSDKKDPAAIGKDKGLTVMPVTLQQMREHKHVSIQQLGMSMSDNAGAKFWLAKSKAGKLGVITEIDGQVYIDVSVGGTGLGGADIYDTAMNYAANNPGKLFIGDPNDLSKAAMSRRLENMLSAAVKYGGTDFVEPHPYQTEGRYGFAPLKWTKGDSLANIRAMVDASVAATAKTNPIATSNVEFDPATQSFRDGQDRPLDAASLSALLGFDGRTPGVGSAGVSTLQRNALFRALLSGADARRALLDAVRGQQDRGSASPSGGLKGAFYSRAQQPSQPALSQKSVEDIIAALKAQWKNAPEIVVAKNMDDKAIPQKVRDYNNAAQQSQGELGAPEGFYYGGKVYMVADTMNTPADVLRVLFHESLGHAGLRGNFGDALKPILQQIVAVRRAEVTAKAKEYGLDMSKEADRLQAAEEVLANMAQDKPELGFVKRAIAAIRTWLRANVPGFEKLDVTDDEIIRSYILPARGWIERGEKSQAGGLPAFSRKQAGTDQTNTPAFRKWFGDSKVVDSEGRPLVVFHGASKSFNVFKPSKQGTYGPGIYFANSKASAESYLPGVSGSETVIEAYVSLQNPWTVSGEFDSPGAYAEDVDSPIVEAVLALPKGRAIMDAARKSGALTQFAHFGPELQKHLKELGHDGIMSSYSDGSMEIVAFRPEQIKSAIGNNGNFDPENPDIRYSRATTLKTAAGRATDMLNEAFSHPGGLSWWDKSVGSMYHLAERQPAFKRVFTAAQNFINDVSFFATEAAELAPKILPRLETWRDLAKSPISAADNKAISKPIMEGTLSWKRDEAGQPVRVKDDDKELAGLVWTNAELRSMFNLTDGQIALYREFRAATDKSLDNMAKADLLRFLGKDAGDMRAMVMDAPDVGAAATLLRQHLLMVAEEEPGRTDVLAESADQLDERVEKVEKLKEKGYAPLSRFGRYTVDVVVDGERQYFSLFDTKRAANQAAAKMREEFGESSVSQGTLSEREFEAFQGITPESLELFGNMLGLDSTGDAEQDKVFQTYLKLTKANRSAMKRLIHRKGVAGYSEDVGRVLAAFVYSNARQTSAALHLGELGEAVQKIPKSQGELKDAAIELSGYIKQPREEAQALRALMFAQYLGGSIASAFVNFTQPFTVSFPYLSQFGGAAASGKALVKAMADQRDGVKLEDGLARALKIAEEQGVVAPQEVHQLMAQARGTATLKSGDGTQAGEALAKANNAWTRLALGWGKLFGMAEQVNRRSTFIAAYRMAVDRKMADPGAFATKAVNETQFINNKANRAQWARGPVGATLMTFKSYSVNYLELLHRLSTKNGPEGKKAAALMLGMLLLVAGGGGLPFAEDLDDAIDMLAQRLGYNFSTKQAKRKFLEDLFGQAGAQFVESGITGLAGSPVDISGRMSMANLIPGTGLLVKKDDHTRDVVEILGPVGDLVKRGFKSVDYLASGEFGKAALEASPRAVTNAAMGVDMADTGMYRDARGRKVIETDTADAIAKAIGFQPQKVARVQEATRTVQNLISQNKVREAEIAEKWAQGMFEKDQAKIDAARAALKDWNSKNPSSPIKIEYTQIIKRVRAMRMSKEDRIAKTAPKEIRATVQRELAGQQ